MEEEKADGTELRSLIRGVIDEFVHAEQAKAEPAYKAELLDERKRREDLERRVNDLVQENARSRKMAEDAERSLVDTRGAATAGGGQGGLGVSRGKRRRSTAGRWPVDCAQRSGRNGASRLSKAVCARESRVITCADYRRIGDGILGRKPAPIQARLIWTKFDRA